MNDDKLRLRLAFKSISYLKYRAQKEFNIFIRQRDFGEPCISCGSPLGQNYHAGHFFSIGAHSSVRFDKDNVHGQCIRCNNFLHGNLANYKDNLIKKIGIEKFNALDTRKNDTVKRKKLDYIDIILKYRNKEE